MKRKIFSIITALALCLGLLPGTAWAAPAGTVTVTIYNTQGPPTELESGKSYVPKEGGGVKERTDETDYLEFSGDTLTVVGTVSLPAANGPTLSISGGTLTITGEVGSFLMLTGGSAPALSIAGGSAAVLDSSVGLTINTSSPSSAFSTMKDYSGDITITGTSGSPAVSGALTILSAGNVTIENEQGMAVGGSLTIQKAGNVTIKSEQGIAVGGSLTIQQAGDVDISGGGSSPAITSNVDITSTGSIKLSSSNFIAVAGKLMVREAASVEVSGGGSDGPAVQNGADITSTGDVTLTSSNHMAVYGDLTVKSGGNVTISGGAENGPPALLGDISITADGDIRITDRKTDSDYSGASLTSKNGEISVPGMVYYDSQLWKYGGEIKDDDPSGENIDLILDAPTCYEVKDKSGNNAGCIYCTPAGDDGTPARLTLDNVRFDNELRVANEEGSVSIIEIKGNNNIKTLNYIGVFAVASGAVLTGSGSFTGGIVAGSFTNESNVTLNAVVNTVTKDKGDSSESITYDATVYGNADASMIYMPFVGSDVLVSLDNITVTKDYKLTITKGAALTVTAENGLAFYSFDDELFTNNGTLVNNGTIQLFDGAAEAENISAAIKKLGLTGSGVVQVMQSYNSVKDTYTNSGAAVVEGPLDFSDLENPPSSLPDGVAWDAETKILTLTDVAIMDTVTLPTGDVTINVTGDCKIKELAVSSTYSTHLTVGGTGKLAVEEHIEISGDSSSLTVDSRATLEVEKGVTVSSSGSVNGTITVNGTLTAVGDNMYSAVRAGKVIVNGGGILEVSGQTGVSVGGRAYDEEGNAINNDSSVDFTGAFTLEEGGKFTADCKGDAISVNPAGSFDASVTPSTAISTPPGYLPDNHQPKWADEATKTSIIIEGGSFTISSANVPKPPTRYTITVNAGEHGTISGSASHTSAAAGTKVSLTGVTATPNEGYSFAGWTSDEVTVAEDGTFTMPEKNVTITANWAETSKPEQPVNPEQPVSPEQPVNPAPSGGDHTRPATYPVKVGTDGIEHGTVTVSPKNAEPGTTVTVTVTPDSGYELDTLTVTDSQGNEVELNDKGGGKYTFTMPSRAVTVKAGFAPTDKPCNGGAGCPSRAFADLDTGKWYHEATDYALQNALMGGYGGNLFGPDDSITRAQFAQILYNKEGRPDPAGSNPFADVADGKWYTPAILWAAANGIVSGYGNGRFGPNDNITREQLAVMLWRYAGSPAAADTELRFTDADRISAYALEAMRWAVENGIINGCGNGLLAPQETATRAQAAQMLKNFLENLGRDT